MKIFAITPSQIKNKIKVVNDKGDIIEQDASDDKKTIRQELIESEHI